MKASGSILKWNSMRKIVLRKSLYYQYKDPYIGNIKTKECERFLFRNKISVLALQSSAQITNDNMQRECDGLLEALVKF